MSVLVFPPAPVNGQLFPSTPVAGQAQYQYEAITQTWRLLGYATGVFPGVYGDATHIPQITVDATGRITLATNISISYPNLTSPPATQSSTGVAGDVAYDSSYFYWYDGANWQRAAADSTPW